ncbi:MAG: DUF6350 family protein [Actinomycetes bacterium]
MRIKAIGQGALQASFVIAVGFVGIFILNLLVWLVEQTHGSSFKTVTQTSARIWLNAQGVPLHFNAGHVAGLAVPEYVFDLIPLGFALLIGWSMYRAGRRLSGESYLGFAWAGAIVLYLAIATTLTSASYAKSIHVLDWQGVFIPTALFSALLIIGSVVGEPLYVENQNPSALRDRVRDYFMALKDKLPWAIKPLIAPALRAGTGVVLAMSAVSAILVSLMLLLNWVEVVRLYQSLQLSFFGTLTVSFGQLALMPNVIALANSWLTGVGFSVGEGSMVSPLGTELGPLPAIPMLAALPVGANSFGIVFILVPLLCAFGATLLIKSHTAELRFAYASATSAAIALGVAIGFVAAIEMWILADFSGGSIGPGRMAVVGANPWLVAGVTFVEVTVASVLAAFFSARPDAADAELIQRTRRIK